MKYLVSITLILFMIFCANLEAGPAAPIETEIIQPDGTSFIAIARGDEYASWVETLEGHTIIKVNDTWYYAESDDAGGIRATSIRVGSLSTIDLQSWPLHLAPTPRPEAFIPRVVRQITRMDSAVAGDKSIEGLPVPVTQNVLTILVDYMDQSFTYSDDSFQSLIYGPANSVKAYYLANSYGRFTIAPAAESHGTNNDGVIHVTRPVAHPNPGKGDNSNIEAREIVALSDSFVDYASFDSDGDGTISVSELSIVIILSGYEASFGATPLTPNVWGHAFVFPSNLTLDGKVLSPYTMFGEAHATSLQNKHQATIGIMAHELGHLMLNLPDLYDSDGSSAGIGNWGLMGGGSWNAMSISGDLPGHMSAWSKVATRFTTAQDIDNNQSGVSFTNADANEDAKRIWIDKYKVTEYFLVENRQMTGNDAGNPGNGLMIWHIDDRQTSNANENRKWVDLEEADGLAQLDSNTSAGDTGDPFPGSSNNTTFNDGSNPNSKDYSGSATQIAVTNISASGPNMTADISTLAGGVTGDRILYNETGNDRSVGFGSATAWMGLRATNNTSKTMLDGVDVFVNDDVGATIDIIYYSSMSGGTPTGMIHSQAGFAATPGWNRLILNTPQPFPVGEDRGIVLKVANNSNTFPLSYKTNPNPSGRSYLSGNGVGTFISLCPNFCGDLNLIALLSGGDTPPAPTATQITPSTTGPTTATHIEFAVKFSENVVNFNNSNDVTITHSGTANSGVNITGAGSSYTVDVTGISGTGSFTLKVNTASDVQNTTGVALSSSVTSAAVTIGEAPATADAHFVPVEPCRIFDTRPVGGAFGDGTTREFRVLGDGLSAQGGTDNCGIPQSATAVHLNFTAVGPEGFGYLRAWPNGQNEPSATLMAFTEGVSISNATALTICNNCPNDFNVKIYGANTNLVTEVVGYYQPVGQAAATQPAENNESLLEIAAAAAAVDGEAHFVPVEPCRIFDTRPAGGPFGDGTTREFRVLGDGLSAQGGTDSCGVPQTATAVHLNFTAVGPEGFGYLRAWPNGQDEPGATLMAFTEGVSISNATALTICNNCPMDFNVKIYGASTNLVTEVVGYYQPVGQTPGDVPAAHSEAFADAIVLAPGAVGETHFVPVEPCRIFDTRPVGGAFGDGTTRDFRVWGDGLSSQGGTDNCGIPQTATAVHLNFTAVGPAGFGYLRAWPHGQAEPGATLMAFTEGVSISNATALSICNTCQNDFSVKIYGAETNLVTEVVGYYQPVSQAAEQ